MEIDLESHSLYQDRLGVFWGCHIPQILSSLQVHKLSVRFCAGGQSDSLYNFKSEGLISPTSLCILSILKTYIRR